MPTHDVAFALLLSKALGPVSFRFVTNFPSGHFKSEVQQYFRVLVRKSQVHDCFIPDSAPSLWCTTASFLIQHLASGARLLYS